MIIRLHTCTKTLEKILCEEPLVNLTTICQFESKDGPASKYGFDVQHHYLFV